MEEEEIMQDKGDVFDEYFDTEEENQPEGQLDIAEEGQEPQEPLIIETRGRWVDFEEITEQTLEEGKTYNIKVGGKCQFMIASKKPIGQGLRANEITYTKDNNKLWIKTR